MAIANSLNIDEAGVQTFNTSTGNMVGSATTQFNILVGDTNNKLTNVAPSATSGIPAISAGAAVNPAFGTAVVAGGGTGNTTFTAYSVIAAGTTATGPFQNASGLGSSTNVFTSAGAGALPAWQAAAATGGKSFSVTTDTDNPIDGETFLIGAGQGLTAQGTTNASTRYYTTATGTITTFYGEVRVGGTLGTSENCTLAIRKNDTTDTNVTTTLQLTALDNTFNNTSLSIAVAAGDFVELKFVCPTWVTNPTSVAFSGTFLIV